MYLLYLAGGGAATLAIWYSTLEATTFLLLTGIGIIIGTCGLAGLIGRLQHQVRPIHWFLAQFAGQSWGTIFALTVLADTGRIGPNYAAAASILYLLGAAALLVAALLPRLSR